MIAAKVLEAMLAAGCSAEQIVATVKAAEDGDAERAAKRREQSRIRQQNHRSRNAVSRVTERDVALQSVTPPVPPQDKEKSPEPPKENSTPPYPPSPLSPPIGGSPHGDEQPAAVQVSQPPSKANNRGSRLSPSWRPTPEEAAYGRSLGIPDAAMGREADRFRDYWIAKPGKDGVKLDWAATWRNWLRRFADEKGFAAESTPIGRAAVDPETWNARLGMARSARQWSRQAWGPMPGETGCTVPASLLRLDDGVGWADRPAASARAA